MTLKELWKSCHTLTRRHLKFYLANGMCLTCLVHYGTTGSIQTSQDMEKLSKKLAQKVGNGMYKGVVVMIYRYTRKSCHVVQRSSVVRTAYERRNTLIYTLASIHRIIHDRGERVV